MPLTPPKLARAAATATALAASMLMSACVVAPVGRYHGASNGVVMVAPPASQVEIIGAAPGPGYFWIDGFWGWTGNHHAWNCGHWEASRPGYNWAPHSWQRDGGGWRSAPGQWRRR